jgi:hypothetical protein
MIPDKALAALPPEEQRKRIRRGIEEPAADVENLR